MSDVTQILQALQKDEAKSTDELLPLIYNELRRLAAHQMAKERPDHTLQPTALVHEAWLRLVGSEPQTWDSRGHFFTAAAEAMRRVLIDNARRKGALRHGGNLERVTLRDIDHPNTASEKALLRVLELVDALSQEDPKAAEVVKLRFFTGLSMEEVSVAMGVTDRTARRDWRFARVWLLDAWEGDAC